MEETSKTPARRRFEESDNTIETPQKATYRSPMALIQFEFRSETLGIASQINVVFSQEIKTQRGNSHRSPVLYLLHGLSDDHSSWLRKSCIERYAEAYDLVVVMPGVHRSFYRNTHAGHRYFDYLSSEVPELCKSYFPISETPEETFVAGLSMGGYGAFKLALSQPQNYAAAASLSGALDLSALAHHREELLPEWASVFGPENTLAGTEDDLLHLAATSAASGVALPKLYQCCGTEDYLYPANQNFRAQAQKQGLPLDYYEGPGDHEWGYWDREIQNVLEWLPLERLETKT